MSLRHRLFVWLSHVKQSKSRFDRLLLERFSLGVLEYRLSDKLIIGHFSTISELRRFHISDINGHTLRNASFFG